MGGGWRKLPRVTAFGEVDGKPHMRWLFLPLLAIAGFVWKDSVRVWPGCGGVDFWNIHRGTVLEYSPNAVPALHRAEHCPALHSLLCYR